MNVHVHHRRFFAKNRWNALSNQYLIFHRAFLKIEDLIWKGTRYFMFHVILILWLKEMRDLRIYIICFALCSYWLQLVSRRFLLIICTCLTSRFYGKTCTSLDTWAVHFTLEFHTRVARYMIWYMCVWRFSKTIWTMWILSVICSVSVFIRIHFRNSLFYDSMVLVKHYKIKCISK